MKPIGLPITVPVTFIVPNISQNVKVGKRLESSIIERNFTPRFFVEHLYKDINLILNVAKPLNVPLPMSETAQELFEQAIDLGLAKEDYSAVVRVLEAQAEVEVR